MPRYYFDARDGDKFICDEDGTELDGIEAASHQAAATLAELARGALPGSVHRKLAIEIRDGAKELLLRACLVFEVERLR